MTREDRSSTCTMIGRSGAWSTTLARLSEGSEAANPCGTTGTITMKMMSITSKTSINGVTLISDEKPLPPELPVVENAMNLTPQFVLGERALDQLLSLDLHKASGGWSLRPPPERELSFLNLLSRFDSGRDKTDIIYSSLVTEVDDLSNLTEIEIL